MSQPIPISRRIFVLTILAGGVCSTVPGVVSPAIASEQLSDGDIMEQWLNTVTTRAPVNTLNVSRFVERIWFLTKTIGWKPDLTEQVKYLPVNVPVGFVTDFASIPRPFWSLLPPDEDYVYAAVIHDYLYWAQERPRNEADEILNIVMKEFKVSSVKRVLIYNAVKQFGSLAWKNNAELKGKGEKRILTKFPHDPRTHWEDWKKNPDNFV